jgi:tetratricopeptide (TPR) repeat protein
MLAAALTVLALQLDTGYADAESLLAARHLTAAWTLAEHLVAHAPADSRAHLLLGRVWLVWPVVGRYQALEEFRTAARLAPRDPEPLYWKIRVGQALGSDEGEAIVRESILRILTITPDYKDCWELFQQLYHSDDIWRRADQALAHHPGDRLALLRRTEIALALEQPARADSLAAMAQQAPEFESYLLRAEAAFDAGRDRDGYAWYDSALTYAERDTADLLWSQVWTIATPREFELARAITPTTRREFFASFWSRRDPNLVTPENERIAEHFRRLRDVRRLFHLLHPYAAFHHTLVARRLAASYLHEAVLADVAAGSVLDVLPPSELLLPNLGDVSDTLGEETIYARANLSAPGLVWLRHGRPDTWIKTPDGFMTIGTWTYHTADGPYDITFSGIPGPFGSHGDYIVAPPRSAREARQVRALLTTDGTSIPATLTARGWMAFFRSATSDSTVLYARTAPDTAAVVLWNASGEVVARGSRAGVIAVTAAPGRYTAGIDVDSGAALGRLRQTVLLPAFEGSLALSGLLLAPGDSLRDRSASLALMPADLAFTAGTPIAAYAEAYGLTCAADGHARYRARYSFQPLRSRLRRLLGGGDPIVFEFAREAACGATLPERLVITPGRLAPGRYRVTLSVTDAATNVKSETVAIDITIH